MPSTGIVSVCSWTEMSESPNPQPHTTPVSKHQKQYHNLCKTIQKSTKHVQNWFAFLQLAVWTKHSDLLWLLPPTTHSRTWSTPLTTNRWFSTKYHLCDHLVSLPWECTRKDHRLLERLVTAYARIRVFVRRGKSTLLVSLRNRQALPCLQDCRPWRPGVLPQEGLAVE